MSIRNKIRANANPGKEGGAAIFIYRQDAQGTTAFSAKPIAFTKQSNEGKPIPMSLLLDQEETQALFESLWIAGFRSQRAPAEPAKTSAPDDAARIIHIADLKECLMKAIESLKR